MILYIGNKLSRHGNTASAVETLGPLLGEKYTIVCISDKLNKIARLLDIILTILNKRKIAKLILIDTYSTQGFFFAVVSAQLALILGIPYILLLHGGNLEQRLRKSPRLSANLFKAAFKLVAPSYFLYDTFKKFGYLNVVYIPNNIQISNYFFKARRMFRPKLLWVRSFSSIYNPTMAIDVVSKLAKTYPDVELCMVGPEKDGSLAATEKYAAELKVSDRVSFKGKLEKSAWHKLSEHYDIFINTTDVDNTPVSVIEAMGLGLPVVSTKAGGIPYLIDDKINGLLTGINDSVAMVDSITALVNEPALGIALTENARRKIESFDWENVKQHWYNLINTFYTK